MALADNYHSLDDVAESVGKSADWVKRKLPGFEHQRVGRSIRFTTEQAEMFIDTFTVRPGSDTDDGDGDPLRDQSTRSKNRK